jgi:hypothetical protein
VLLPKLHLLALRPPRIGQRAVPAHTRDLVVQHLRRRVRRQPRSFKPVPIRARVGRHVMPEVEAHRRAPVGALGLVREDNDTLAVVADGAVVEAHFRLIRSLLAPLRRLPAVLPHARWGGRRGRRYRRRLALRCRGCAYRTRWDCIGSVHGQPSQERVHGLGQRLLRRAVPSPCTDLGLVLYGGRPVQIKDREARQAYRE